MCDPPAQLMGVQPDADFECIAVMMDHTQDVKTIAWHPKEEVRVVGHSFSLHLDPSNSAMLASRPEHLHLKAFRVTAPLTTDPRIGIIRLAYPPPVRRPRRRLVHLPEAPPEAPGFIAHASQPITVPPRRA